LLNFLKIQKTDSREVREPKEVALLYIKGTFIPDCIAVFPYANTYPSFIFLRFLKLLKIADYQNYFNSFIFENLLPYLEKQTLHKIIDIFQLLVLLCFTSHFFAVIWMLIGVQGLEEDPDNQVGWIYTFHLKGLQQMDYWS